MQREFSKRNKSENLLPKGLNLFGGKKKYEKKIRAEIYELRKELNTFVDIEKQMGTYDVYDHNLLAIRQQLADKTKELNHLKQEGIQVLSTLKQAGKGIFSRLNSVKENLVEKAKNINLKKAGAFGSALLLAGLSFTNNPAFADNLGKQAPKNTQTPTKTEQVRSSAVVITSAEHAKKLNGTIKPGTIVEINGRRVKLVGDGTGKVNLIQSYRVLEKKFAPPQAPSPVITTTKPDSISTPTKLQTATPANIDRQVPKKANPIPTFEPKSDKKENDRLLDFLFKYSINEATQPTEPVQTTVPEVTIPADKPVEIESETAPTTVQPTNEQSETTTNMEEHKFVPNPEDLINTELPPLPEPILPEIPTKVIPKSTPIPTFVPQVRKNIPIPQNSITNKVKSDVKELSNVTPVRIATPEDNIPNLPVPGTIEHAQSELYGYSRSNQSIPKETRLNGGIYGTVQPASNGEAGQNYITGELGITKPGLDIRGSVSTKDGGEVKINVSKDF